MDSILFLGTVCFLWTGFSGIGVNVKTGSEQSPPGHIALEKQWLLAISCSMYVTLSSVFSFGHTPHPGCGPLTSGISGVTRSCMRQNTQSYRCQSAKKGKQMALEEL